MRPSIPEFGAAEPGVEYVLRLGGYAVIFDAAGDVAAVRTPSGLALPGGGQERGESPEGAAIREAREECGLVIRIGQRIGVADELVFADTQRRHYRKRCTFFLAAIIDRCVQQEIDHELVWLTSQAAAAMLLHQSQRWAISEALALMG